MSLINESALKDLREMDDGQGIFLKDILTLYLSESKKILKDISEQSAADNFEMLSKNAHKLKGSSLSVGAAKLAEICHELEKNPDQGEKKNETIINLNNVYAGTETEFNKIISDI